MVKGKTISLVRDEVALTKPVDVAVGDQADGESEKGLVDGVASFPADAQAAEAVQPGDNLFNDQRKVPRPVQCACPRSAITGRMPRCRTGRLHLSWS
jgi:hypothetical protein